MTVRRDSLRDVLGPHLERAEADAEADRKAAAMLDRDALRDRLDHVRALPAEDATREVATSERREHVVVTAPAAAEPRRDTARKIKIDPSVDPRLLDTDRVAAREPVARSRSRLGLVVLAGAALLALAVVAVLASSGTTPAPPEVEPAPPGARTEPAASPAAAPEPSQGSDATPSASTAGPSASTAAPSATAATVPSATPSIAPTPASTGDPASSRPGSKPDGATKPPGGPRPPSPPTASPSSPGASPPVPPAPSSPLKPLGGGPSY